ncbi:hypothetical protein L1987_61779 [Smallanthus sonchifolius]|uniref:Uncharacterized protein n=1 Tax=Smallanthus sonchifolius TaxID=185202 RepID=A0ACB9C8I1_9ASTR|nr:hypothetical protein L1987_61779 [Smallanthus sonchifolius]
MESSPRFRSTDSRGEDSSTYPTKLRLMCSNGGHIVPRPHDKSLCYVGGETRMVVVDRHITLLDLTHRLSKTLLRSSSSSPPASSFTLKYQLPSEDLDSLISVTTDEDLENMIDEYGRLNSSSRLRLFIFPTNPESSSSIGSFLENPIKLEDWFLNALNGTNSAFSDTSSFNCLLDLDDEISLPERKGVSYKTTVVGSNLRGNCSGQDVHSIPDSPMMETTSSFGSASSTPSQANLMSITVNADDQKRHHKHHDDTGVMASLATVAVSGSPMSFTSANQEHSDPLLSYQNRSDQGLETAYLKQHQQQQKQSTGFDLASIDLIMSDLTITDQSSPVFQIQSPNSNNRAADPNDTPDQTTRIQILQQQKLNNSAYHQLHNQQPQFVPPLQYIHHHPPVTSYYQHHPHHPPTDQPNFMYYIPTSQPPYNFPFQPPQPVAATTNNQAAGKTELPAGAYRTTNSGAPQLVRLPSGYQNQPQHVGYYATQAVLPLLTGQYQNLASISPVEASLQEQQMRTAQP